jgi:peptide/nickel transport system permease protein
VGERAAMALSVRGLTVSFRTGEGLLQAVRGLDYSVARGQCLGIVGESGSGKSVCATAALGLLDKSADVRGSIEIDGRLLSELTDEQKRLLRGRAISIIFQEPSRSFDPIYSIGKTFEETIRAKEASVSAAECRSRAVKLLGEVHIPRAEERLKNFPQQFSGGMLQRIMIALALANDPEILVADEPTTALDVTIQAQIVGLLRELQVKRGLSLIFISHDLRLVAQIADRIMVMYGGLVLELGDAEEVLRHPRSPYTRALLDSVPEWGSHYSAGNLISIAGAVPNPVRPEPGCPFAPRCGLVQDVCRARLPDLLEAPGEPAIAAERAGESLVHGMTLYRCVVPGVKR